MSSSAEHLPHYLLARPHLAAAVVAEDLAADSVAEALLAERRAYQELRTLVPDLMLSTADRRPLTEVQEAAIAHHAMLANRLQTLRSTGHAVALHVVRDLPA